MENKDLVWYVCYGSNLCYERFMIYINGCNDKSEPLKKENFIIPYELYFAGEAKINWDGGATAYIDLNKASNTYGVKYLITREQYEQVKKQEGKNYQREVPLGVDKDGIKQVSFTQTIYDRDGRKPSQKYINTIANGLIENYGFSREKSIKYIESHYD